VDVDADTYSHFSLFVDGGSGGTNHYQRHAPCIPQVDCPKLTSEVKYSPHIMNFIFHDTSHEDRSSSSL